jgi:hypothetical protein
MNYYLIPNLPLTYYLLLITYYLILPLTYYLLPITYYLLPNFTSYLNPSIPHIQTPIQLIAQCLKKVVTWDFDDFP